MQEVSVFRGVLLVCLVGLCSGLDAASFDCSRAHTKLENMICSTPKLNAADTRMGEAYRAAVRTFPLKGFVEATQQTFLVEFRTCREVAECLNLLERRLAELAMYQGAKVYSDASGRFDPNENIAFLVHSTQGRTFLTYYENSGCGDELEVKNDNGRLVVDYDENPMDRAVIEIQDKWLLLDDFISCNPRTAIAKGDYARVRVGAKP